LFNNILKRFGVKPPLYPHRREGVGAGDQAKHADVVPETPSNPLRKSPTLRRSRNARAWCIAGGRQLLLHARSCSVRSTWCGFVIHSATKYSRRPGQGMARVLGRRDVIFEGLNGFLRSGGPTLSPFTHG